MKLSRRGVGCVSVLALVAAGVSVAGMSGAQAASSSCTDTETTVAGLNSDIVSAGSTPVTLCLGGNMTADSGQNLALGSASAVTLDLQGHSLTINNSGNSLPGITVPAGAALTIADSVGGGALAATGGFEAAGIGGQVNNTGGTVTITGGAVTATGGAFASGIGGGNYASGGTVTVTGGTVTATGGEHGAGIGGGGGCSGGSLTVTGGTVTATGGEYGAGIGGGAVGLGSTVTVSGGLVTATGGYDGAAIGGGYLGGGSTLTLDGVGSATTAGNGYGQSNAAVVSVSGSGLSFTQTGSDATSSTNATTTATFASASAPVFGAGVPVSGVYGSGYSFQLTASVPASQAAASFSASGSALPPGLSLSPSGLLSGVPMLAGIYPVTVTASSGGATSSEQVTVTIGQAPLTVLASSQSVTYGTAPLAVRASYSGLVNGDAAPATAPSCSTTATSSSTVGSYAATCSGAADPNYTISYTAGSVVVTPAALIVTASSGLSTYGSAPVVVKASYVGLRNGDDSPATAPTCTTTATSSSKTGTYPTSCSGAADPDYSITYVAGVDTVGTAALTVVASSQSVVYGSAPVAVTASYVGLTNGDKAPAKAPICSTTVTDSSNVGKYASSCVGAADGDYSITYVPGVVVVTPAPLTVIASSQTVLYGKRPAAVTASYVGLTNGDKAPATAPTCSTTATSASNVGTYAATCSGAVDPDYTITYTPGTVTVTPAPVSITVATVHELTALLAGKVTFSATVTNTATGVPAAGVTVTFTASTVLHTSLGCVATTNGGGVATCADPHPLNVLLLPPKATLTATVPAAGSYLGGTGLSTFTLI